MEESFRFADGNVFNEIRDRGATYGVGSGPGNHSPRDGVAPDGNDPDDRPSAFAKENSRAEIESESAEKLAERPRGDGLSGRVYNETDHERL